MERELHADNQAICSLSPDEVRPLAIRKKPLLLRAILEELGAQIERQYDDLERAFVPPSESRDPETPAGGYTHMPLYAVCSTVIIPSGIAGQWAEHQPEELEDDRSEEL